LVALLAGVWRDAAGDGSFASLLLLALLPAYALTASLTTTAHRAGRPARRRPAGGAQPYP